MVWIGVSVILMGCRFSSVFSHTLIVSVHGHVCVRVCICASPSVCVAGLLTCERMGEKRDSVWERARKLHVCEMEGHCVLRNTFHQSTVMVILFHVAEYLSVSCLKQKCNTLSLRREPGVGFWKAWEHRGQVYFFPPPEMDLMFGLLTSPPK